VAVSAGFTVLALSSMPQYVSLIALDIKDKRASRRSLLSGDLEAKILDLDTFMWIS
jgi:hypothetical protein